MPIAQVHGVNILYDIVGDHGPWLALTTGGRNPYQEFLSLAGKIAEKGFRVLLHDRRNTGGSDILIDGEEVLWTDDLHALMSHLGALPAFVGGSSSGARMSLRFYLRYRDAVRGLLLLRVTGGAFAAQRLPENYYGQFIRAAKEGGMAAVCATEQYRERIKANPANRERLLNMDPERYIEVMSRWREQFVESVQLPVIGVTESELSSIGVPVIIIPGNDKTHSSASGRIANTLIPGSEIHHLGVDEQDVPLVPFAEWAPYEDAIADTLASFMHRAGLRDQPHRSASLASERRSSG